MMLEIKQISSRIKLKRKFFKDSRAKRSNLQALMGLMKIRFRLRFLMTKNLLQLLLCSYFGDSSISNDREFEKIVKEKNLIVNGFINWGKLINDFMKEGAKVNPYFLYMRGVKTQNSKIDALWLNAVDGDNQDMEAFANHFERVKNALYKAAVEVNLKRKAAIVDALSSFPKLGVPDLIAEYDSRY